MLAVRFINFLETHSDLAAGPLLAAFLAELANGSGPAYGRAQEAGITLIAVDFKRIHGLRSGRMTRLNGGVGYFHTIEIDIPLATLESSKPLQPSPLTTAMWKQSEIWLLAP